MYKLRTSYVEYKRLPANTDVLNGVTAPAYSFSKVLGV